MMTSSRLRAVIALAFLGLALVHMLVEPVREGTDIVFLGFVTLALAVLVIPWDRMSGFTVGGVSVTLESPQLAGAIAATMVDRVHNERLHSRLAALGSLVQTIQGSRIMWVDDHPESIIGERRILRALGVEVVQAVSTKQVVQILRTDCDFDLLISDVQRTHEDDRASYPAAGTEPLHEGANFVELLRTGRVAGLPDIPPIRRIPVVFYAAYPWHSLRMWTAAARDIEPGAVATNDVTGLVENVVMLLARARREPIDTPSTKAPT